MNQHSKPWKLSLFALLFASLAVGCTHENPLSLQLEGNLSMVRLPGAGLGITGHCQPEGETLFRPNGTLDLMVTNRYDFFPRIRNKLPTTQLITGLGPQNLRADASTVTISGAEMVLSLDTTSAGPLNVTGAVPWQTSWFTPFVTQLESEAFVGTKFALIPAIVGDALQKKFGAFPGRATATQKAMVKVTILGTMADGTAVQSNSFSYPIELCWGCLVSVPVTIEGVGVDPELQRLICSTKTIGDFTPPCMPGNDETLPCTFYCSMCDQDNSCDEVWCPSP